MLNYSTTGRDQWIQQILNRWHINYGETSQVTDQHAVTSAPAERQIDEEKFLGFMQKNLVWSFVSMSQAEYLLKSKEGRVSLVSRYYTEMSNGENNLFFA